MENLMEEKKHEQLKKLHDAVVESLLSTNDPKLQREFIGSIDEGIKRHKALNIENAEIKLKELREDFKAFCDLGIAGQELKSSV